MDATDNKILSKNRSVKEGIQMLKRPSVVFCHNWLRCTYQWSNVEKQVRGVS
jgi:hypothetical protein